MHAVCAFVVLLVILVPHAAAQPTVKLSAETVAALIPLRANAIRTPPNQT